MRGRRVGRAGAAAVVALVVGAGALAWAPPAGASGIITHSWMALEAVSRVEDPDLRALLSRHRDLIESGAHFPDSGYAPGTTYGEEAHWRRFANTYADQIAADPACGDLTAADGPCAERIAHLMGAVGHGIGDEVWDWLFEPAAVDRGERYLPPALQQSFSRDGLELQMDMIAIEDYGRRTTPVISPWPSRAKLVQVFAAVGRGDVDGAELDLGYTAISVARNADRSLAATYHDLITANMPWTSSHIVTAPGGIRFAARAIAAAWDDLWLRMLGTPVATTVGTTYPAAGQVEVPTTGWDRADFLPGSRVGGGGAASRIMAVLSQPLPYVGSPGGPPAPLPSSAMTLTEVVSGDPVPAHPGFPRVVPYGPDSGAHSVGFQPADDLLPCTEYRVDVTADLLDADGDAVTPTSWTFTTAGCPGTVRRPDAQLRIGATGAFIGADVIGANGTGQGWTARVRPGRTATFTVKLRNAGNAADRLRVQGQGSSGPFTVRYLDGSRNVTAAVVAGDYLTPPLAAGASRPLRVEVAAARTARSGVRLTRLVKAFSAADGARVDGVRATTVVSSTAEAATGPAPLSAEVQELLARPDAERWIQVCQLDA